MTEEKPKVSVLTDGGRIYTFYADDWVADETGSRITSDSKTVAFFPPRSYNAVWHGGPIASTI